MSNPLSLLPYALAAGGGRVGEVPATALIAAGFTLLQRSASLVRALAGARSGILLPTSRACITALAASDGHGAVLLDPSSDAGSLALQLDDAGVAAVFTTRALAARLSAGDRLVVLLDDVPQRATVVAGGTETAIDLGSHFGLDLEGEVEAGRDEECLVVWTASVDGTPRGAVLTHRNVLAAARSIVDAVSMLPGDRVLATLPLADELGLCFNLAAPLLAGAQVTAMERFEAASVLAHLEQGGITMMAGRPSMFGALVAALERRGTSLVAPSLRVCVCGGARLEESLQDQWFALAGSELRQGYSIPEAPLCLLNPPHFPNRRGTLGIPMPGVAVTVRDHCTGAPTPRGRVGELCARGDAVFAGYLHDRGGGRRVRAGWLHTGDRGVERADGTFEMAGRDATP